MGLAIIIEENALQILVVGFVIVMALGEWSYKTGRNKKGRLLS